MSTFPGICLEVVCFSADAALAAQEGGADRVELCASSPEGGITPSLSIIEFVVSGLEIPVYVMIRPRGGDFLYSDMEIDLMRRDIELCKAAGADGVVFGILEKDGSVNSTQCKELVELASPMSCTFHRAFDMTKDKQEAMEEIIACGFDRILTSGGVKCAVDGKEVIIELNKKAAGRITIMPGGGVNAECIKELVSDTGLSEFHISARTYIPSGMEYHHPGMHIGPAEQDDFRLLTVDPDAIRNIRQLAEQALYA